MRRIYYKRRDKEKSRLRDQEKYKKNREELIKKSLDYYYEHHGECKRRCREYKRRIRNKKKEQDPVYFEIKVDCELHTHDQNKSREYKFPKQFCDLVIGTCLILKIEKKEVVVKEKYKGSEREKEYQKNYIDINNKTERRKVYQREYQREYQRKYRKNKET